MTPLTASKAKGHTAAIAAYLIFGLNIIICTHLTATPILSPYAIFLLRSAGAGALFWIISLFLPAEKVAPRHLASILLASMLGFTITQLSFLIAVKSISPMATAIMSSLSPIYTMIVAAIAIHEPITPRKTAGVATSLAGVLYLIITGMAADTPTSLTGILLMVVNALSFSIYLGAYRPLIERYSVVTFMKWIFLFATITALPLGLPELIHLHPADLPLPWIGEMAYLIIMATFVAYFLIPIGQKHIRPTLISMYSYLQPIVAIAVSIAIGMDTLTPAKALATLMVFAGVIIVSRSKAAPRKKIMSLKFGQIKKSI